MKKTITTILAAALITVLSVTNSIAQERISFKRGSTSASVGGTIGVNRGVAGANYRYFVVRARRGQTISATVSSRNGKVAFADNDSTTLTIDTDGNRDYDLRIYNGGARSTTFTLTVSIR